MNNTDRQWEENYLKKTLEVIAKNLNNYSRETERMQAEIDEMLERYHDNDVELWTLLNNTITLNEHMKAALKRNEKARDKPYFGRIIFQDETLRREESLYIGKGGIARDRTHQVVVDWRAPVANAYYENGLGKCSYTAPDGKELPIDLKLKRTYEIADGELTEYFDTEVVANDDLLTKYLSKNKQAVLGEIVASIQKEQNEIIRRSPYHNLIVQGVAGSGKTTVAMHRISYILYNYQERFKPQDFYIVGSNRILLNYITGVLPDLDVYGVRQMTMEQLFTRLLYEDWDEKKYRIRPVGGTGQTGKDESVKGTEWWYLDLIAFIRRLEQNTISQESIYLNPKQFVEGIRDGKSGVYDLTGKSGLTDGFSTMPQTESVSHRNELVELVSGESVARYVSRNPQVSIQSKINMLNERLLIKVRDEFTGKGIKYTEAERKAILKAYRGRYGGREWKISIYKLYRDFLEEQRGKGYSVSLPADSFDVYDLAALAVIYKLVKETEVISEAHHIVIDEAQDFGMCAYRALHTCIRDCTYTVMGDVSQNIHFGYGLGDWEALRKLLLSDPQDSFGVLKKSYRNTVEISNFATDILRHGNFSIYPVEPIIRHGREVMIETGDELPSKETSLAEETENKSRRTGVEVWRVLARRGAEICREWQRKGYETIAVVCREAMAARRVAAELSSHIEIKESDLESADFGSGIMVLPVEYTKGLEFDAVLIWNPTGEDYPVDDGHAKLLYVAATRALHELCVLHSGNLSGLIADPLPDGFSPSVFDLKDEKKEHAGMNKKAVGKTETIRKNRATVTIPRSAEPPRKESEPESVRSALTDACTAMPVFGDMPATEKLRPAGHSKINLAVRWCAKQADGLYLQSQYGTLRVSPVGSGIVRLTFARSNELTGDVHPKIAVNRMEKNWKYRDNGKAVEVVTGELFVEIDKASGSIQYFRMENSSRSGKKLLLSERRQESRQLEPLRFIDSSHPAGSCQSWLFLDWQKGEQLSAFDPVSHRSTDLRGTAKYLSGGEADSEYPPLILSEKGYGLLPANTGISFCCDIPAYGSYLYMETKRQMDYYIIAGKHSKTILDAYACLCGLNV